MRPRLINPFIQKEDWSAALTARFHVLFVLFKVRQYKGYRIPLC